MRTAALTVWAAMLVLVAANARAQDECPGDCNGNGTVLVNEVITCVNTALGGALTCAACDVNGNGSVAINELIASVNSVLCGCAGCTTNPTPTATPSAGPSKERRFVITPGMLLADPATTTTGLFTSGLSGSSAASAFCSKLSVDAQSCDVPAELTLVLGEPDANGVASLTLKNDVILEIGIVDGSRFCLQLKAANSSGSIDCDGGTPYDVLATRPKDAPGVDFTFQTGLGDPAGPGNGNLIIPTRFQVVPSGDNTACDALPDPDEVTFAFTTTLGVSTVTDTDLSLEIAGQGYLTTAEPAPFSCENFSTRGSGGALIAPLPANQAPIGNVVSALRLGEQAP